MDACARHELNPPWCAGVLPATLAPMELAMPDGHHLRAAVGWLELGDASEALAELNQLSVEGQANADALEIRWLALAEQREWEAASLVGRALILAAPERAGSWLHHSYALRRASSGGLAAAFDALSSVAEKFPEESTIPYNLACYSCQMQRPAEDTLGWLQRALKIGGREIILRMALQDSDLKPLHAEIARLMQAA